MCRFPLGLMIDESQGSALGLPRAPQGRHHGHGRPYRQGHAGHRRRGRQERLGTRDHRRSRCWRRSGGPPGRAGIAGHAYNGGEAPIDKERFVNARAEDFWTLRELFEAGEIDIDPDDDKLAAQLGSIKWGIDSRGRIKIESKDDMRSEDFRRLIGRTPQP